MGPLDEGSGKRERYDGSLPGQPAGPRFCSVMHDLLGDPFWAVYRRGLRDAAARFGCAVDHRAPEHFSPADMADLLEGARRSRHHGILASIPDAEAVEGPLRAAIADGVPVLAVNAADPRPAHARIPYRFFIGADDLEGGRAAARELLGGLAGTDRGPLPGGERVPHRPVRGLRLGAPGRRVPCDRLRVPGDDLRAAVTLVSEYLAAHRTSTWYARWGRPGAGS